MDVTNNTSAKCVIMVGAILDSYGVVLLGDTFIRNYYTVFNYSAPYSVSFAQSAYLPTLAATPTDTTTMAWWLILIIVVGSVALVTIPTVLILKKKGACCFAPD